MLELADNPSTAFTETELHADPTYDYTDGLPDWLKRRIARQQKIAEIFKWYQDLHWGWKLGVGIGLLIGAALLTFFSGGGWLGVLSVVAQVAIGVGLAVGLYSLGALFGFYDFSLEGLGNVALDAFLASSAIVFVSSGVSFIKSLSRTSDVGLQSYELDPRSVEMAKEGNPSNRVFRKRVWQNEYTFNKGSYKSNQWERMMNGKAPIVNGRSLHLHHVVGKAVDPYYVIKITASQHTAIHKAIGYHVFKPKLAWTLENAIKYGGLI